MWIIEAEMDDPATNEKVWVIVHKSLSGGLAALALKNMQIESDTNAKADGTSTRMYRMRYKTSI